jgi:hypothetical protein
MTPGFFSFCSGISQHVSKPQAKHMHLHSFEVAWDSLSIDEAITS